MASPRKTPFGSGLGYDPAKPQVTEKVISNTRVELPGAAYALEKTGYKFHELTVRPPQGGTQGKDITVRVNQFKLKSWTSKDVHQYDILIGTGAEKKGLIMVIWKSKAVQDHLKSLTGGVPLLWDGNRIAWSSTKFDEQRIMVDMDAEKGRTPREGRENKFYCQIRHTKVIRMAAIGAYLTGTSDFTNDVLENINFLDHVMRQWPSESYVASKRNFFSRGSTRVLLDNVIEAQKGVYASVRMCSPKASVDGLMGLGLAINVDVANGTFWSSQDVCQAARNLCKTRNRNLDYRIFRDLLTPVKDSNGNVTKSREFKEMQWLTKLRFHVKHRGKEAQNKEFQIKAFTWDPRNREGAHAKNTRFPLKNRNTGQEELITVFDYYLRTYNIHLQHWYLPLIESTRGGLFPMELCTLLPNQKFLHKLTPEQTAAMIKFAVTRPKQRLESIQHGVEMLKWNQDPYLKHFGITVDPNMTLTKAKLLPNPEVMFGSNQKLNPGTQGRWDLRGKKLFLSNPQPLKTWGVCIVGGCVPVATVQNFFKVFIQVYIGHGGRVDRKEPLIHDMAKGDGDLGTAVEQVRNKVGNVDRCDPQIIFFILPGRDSFMYERLKKNMECRYALFSQMLNVVHVNKAAPQYCSNVAMKVNAKLGGTTSKAIILGKPQQSLFKVPTMIIGADVSHASPGSPQASMAALTMSMDQIASRYAATVQVNGYRVEMITAANFLLHLMPLFKKWVTMVGGNKPPVHIYYFRDGVSEGQFSQVIEHELGALRNAINEKSPGAADKIKFTVVVCTKRHHIRFFPKDSDTVAADKNGNVHPGTLVQYDVTHPFEHDFYLSSHSAIQGTARPVHYQVIYDDAGVTPDELHRLIYNHCYQYMRSTTPVSLYPAVYYAHLASNRARAHESVPSSSGPRGGEKFMELQQDNPLKYMKSSQAGSHNAIEAAPLLPFGNLKTMVLSTVERIRTGMWYI